MFKRKKKPDPLADATDLTPEEFADMRVLIWLKEVNVEGKKTPKLLIEADKILPWPFAQPPSEEEVRSETSQRAGQYGWQRGKLWVASLPDGRYIDVEKSAAGEAQRRLGGYCDALLVGSFSREDCERIGIELQPRRSKRS